MLGNDCKVDSKGYIIPLQYINKTEQAHFHKRLTKYPPFYIHLDCDNYKPCVMEKNKQHFCIMRRVPSGYLKFFFSSDSKVMESKEYPNKVLENPLKLEFKDMAFVNIKKVNMIFIESEP